MHATDESTPASTTPYTPKPATLARIERAFAPHPPTGTGQADRYAEIRGSLRALAGRLTELCPESRELSTALHHLEDAQSWAIAAICRNEGP
jgi:hypothetical protein